VSLDQMVSGVTVGPTEQSARKPAGRPKDSWRSFALPHAHVLTALVRQLPIVILARAGDGACGYGDHVIEPKPVVHLLVGLPGSGKTTYVKAPHDRPCPLAREWSP
jgi:hypothetical protein